MAALQELHPDSLWVAEMPFTMGGVPAGARMTVVRLGDDSLVLISPIALTPDLRNELESLGRVGAIIAPNSYHYLHLDEAATAYPEAKVFALPAVAEKVKCEPLDLSDPAAHVWNDSLESSRFRGSRYVDEFDFFHPSSGTLIVTDISFNLREFPSIGSKIMGTFLGVKNRFGPSRVMRSSINDTDAARASLEAILNWNFDRIVVAHGAIVESGGRKLFEDAWEWLAN